MRISRIPALFLLLALFLAQAANAKEPRFPWPPPMPPVPPPTLKVPSGETPVKLVKMDIRVAIRGLEAETTTTMTFRNPNPRQLAGELEFPLPDGGTVAGYALDVNGRMVDGVVVAKEKARVVMETEMRRRVDPGIVEHVRGNAFRTRVYPIPPNGERTVRVTSVASLDLSGGAAAYHLPLPRGIALPSLELEVQVAKGPVRPEIGGFGNLTLTEWDDRWVAKASLAGATPQDDLYIRLPDLPGRFSSVEAFEGGHYLAISDVPPPARDSGRRAAPPARVAVAWDASGSRSPAAVAKDREFLARLLSVAWRDCEIDLVVFRDRAESVSTFAVRNGDASRLLAHLDALPYDGGTDLSALDLATGRFAGVPPSAWLLFTDGLHTMGSGLPGIGGLPVHVIASDSRRDIAVQRFIAERSGGQFLDLAAIDAAAAVEALAAPPPALIRVDAAPGMLADVQYRHAPGSGRATVYARLLADGPVTLVYAAGGREVARHTVEARRGDATEGRLLARAWAASRVADLSVFPDRNAEEMLSLGRRYGLVTPGTSLIVLETLQQYLEHRIAPPASWPEMLDPYLAALKSRQAADEKTRSGKIDQVLGWWRARVGWWERKFDTFGKPPGRDSGIVPARPGSSGPVPAMAAPAPMSAAAPRMPSEGASGSDRMMARRSEVAGIHQESAARLKGGEGAPAGVGAAIAVKPWEPDSPFLSAIKARPASGAYAAYLEQREAYSGSPSFYLDCAGYLLSVDRPLGIRVLSNLAELKIDDADLLRVFAWRLREAGELDRAIEVLEKVRALRPEEPQSHRDLALALSDRMDRDGNTGDGLRAARLLNDVVEGGWARFQEVEVVALMELNRLLAAMERLDPASAGKADFIDPRLRKLLDLDVRIVLSWDANNTDIDLHVVEPSGEEAFYGYNLTHIGGHVSRDFTQGYGPEEYVLRRALPGVYKIRCRYYGSSQQTLLGPATVTATVVTNFGRPGEKRQALTLRLDKVRDMVDIGEIRIDGTAGNSVDAPGLGRDSVGKLKAGMEPAEVERILGPPERIDGSGLRVFVYRLEGGSQLRLGFGPGLLWAREATPGAELELPLRK